MTSRSGTTVSFLGRVRKDLTVATVPQPPAQCSAPAFSGTVEEFITSHSVAMSSSSSSHRVSAMLHNRVKKCGLCGKPNGFTLSTCNQCGHSLTSTEITNTPNVFMGFVFGIGKAPFPLMISIRYQDESTIVFDDLLALSPLHLNAIPTRHFIPDWRYLLRRPQEGLAVLDDLLRRCQDVANTQFLCEGSTWKSQFLREAPEDATAASATVMFDAAQHMCCGFNYPPSQSQLHLQYICPNVMPFQHAQFLSGVHFTFGRFFPFTYVRRCLELLINPPPCAAGRGSIPVELLADDASIEEIVRYFGDVLNHDYAAAHALYGKKFADLSETFSCWSSDFFDGLVTPFGERGRGVLLPIRGAADSTCVPQSEGVAIAELAAADKMRLQNYGRPYHPETGKPTGSYYAFPKQPESVDPW